jgi:putative salt-induced outer membrane protein YdiY
MRLSPCQGAALALAAFATPLTAQESPVPAPGRSVAAKPAGRGEPPGIYAQADLSYVLTSGNSRSSSLGFKGSFARRFLHHALAFELGGLRASSSSGKRVAVGTPEDFELTVPEAEPTAEDDYLRGRYEYQGRGRLYGTTGVGWERNRYSGIAARWVWDAGLGCVLLAGERRAFRPVLAVTYTDERHEGVSPSPGAYLGARLSWDLRVTPFSGTSLLHTLILDQSLEDARVRRLDSQLGLQVAMTRTLGLKVNWRALYNNQPPLVKVPLVGPTRIPAGLTVMVPYRRLDQGLSASLVLTLAPERVP